MDTPCKQCRETPGGVRAWPWYAVFALVFLSDSLASNAYCDDCAGGRNFIAIVVGILFVLPVVGLTIAFW